MSLELKITTALKEAMKSKNQTALTALRAVKSAILLHKTQGSSVGELSQEDEMKILQKFMLMTCQIVISLPFLQLRLHQF